MDDMTLSQLLMKEKRLKILNTLMENRDAEFTISKLSEKSDVGYKTTHGMVEKLENFGIIDVEERGGSKFVSLNEESPYIDVLEKLGGIDSQPLREVAEDYADELVHKYDDIEKIGVFGSVINSLPTEDSDIDMIILIDSEANLEEIEEKIWSVRDRYEREENVNISPVVMKKEKFELNAENRNPFESKVKDEAEFIEGEAEE
jgi:predicted nucleotidyltransferase/predicted transcriptional regulator